MENKNKLIAYAMDFASYLVEKIEGIDKIILHGSVARGDFGEDSDIDLFIDSLNQRISKEIKRIEEDYYKTKKYKLWELKGVKNRFSLIIGRIDSKEWADLKRAVINTGILLYGKYKANIKRIAQYTLFSFENISPEARRVKVYRKLFGFSLGRKDYSGLIEQTGSIRVGKGAILVPIEHTQKIKDYFRKEKVSAKLFDLFSDSKI